MQGTMQSPSAIDISLIPQTDLRSLAGTILEAAEEFYRDPANEARFRDWQRRRETG